MKRFTDYWGTKTATPNLKLLFIPDSTTQVADFEAGTVDIIMPPQSAVSGLKSDSNAVVKERRQRILPSLSSIRTRHRSTTLTFVAQSR